MTLSCLKQLLTMWPLHLWPSNDHAWYEAGFEKKKNTPL